MRIPFPPTSSEIDKQLQHCKPRHIIAAPLPWGPALFGLAMVMAMQALL